MKRKPSWGFWITWLLAYTALDMVLSALLHGGSATWSQVPAAVEGALFGATLTWLWALRKGYKADGF